MGFSGVGMVVVGEQAGEAPREGWAVHPDHLLPMVSQYPALCLH